MNACVVCSKESETLCQRCRTPYCSRTCQAEDWLIHKPQCIPMPPLVTSKKHPEKFKPKSVSNESSFQPLRPPNKGTMLPTQTQKTSSIESRKSFFDNPFKRNSQNIRFNISDTKKPLAEDIKNIEKIAPPSSVELIPVIENKKNVTIAVPANEIKNEMSSPSSVKIPVDTKKTEIVSMPLPRMLSKTTLAKIQSNDEDCLVPSANEIKNEMSSPSSVKIPVDTKETEIVSMPLPRMLSKITQSNDPTMEIVKESESNVKRPKLTMDDIEIVPLPPGKKLVCTDSSLLEEGYISVCINDMAAIQLIDRLSIKITDYCSKINECYKPTDNELCLCKFDEDNLWYRGVVTKVIDSDMFEIRFIDFGNMTTVTSNSIRQMAREFTHHCLVNKCYIKDFPGEPKEADIAKVKQIIEASFVVSSMEKIGSDQGQGYIISL